ncbi:MAG: FG-GAP repeat protein [Rickettsiales bacterium]|nr:FG-GAP repeat protein [Rickettsiales bacterium]
MNDIDLSTLTTPQGIKIHGDTADARSGIVVTGIGDVNNDTIDDFLVTSQGTGTAYIFWGKTSGWANIDLASFSSSHGIKITGGSACILAASKAGDVNNDDIDDFLLGIPCQDKTYLIFGKASGWTNIDLTSLTAIDGVSLSSNTQTYCPYTSVTGIGDVNNDNMNDILIGTPCANNGAGGAYLVFGKSTSWTNINLDTLTSSEGIKITCTQSKQVGAFTGKIGDINGDNIDDIAIDVPRANNKAGVVIIIFGKTTGWADISLLSITSPDAIKIHGANSGDWIGSSIAGIDVNNDGISDLIIAARGAKTVYVVFGKNTAWTDINLGSLTATEGIKIQGMTPWIVDGVKDVNGDGINDILISDPSNKISYLIFGKTNLADIDIATMTSTDGIKIHAENVNDWAESIHDAGDINKDGLNDFLVGAADATYSGRTYSGQSYLILGDDS